MSKLLTPFVCVCAIWNHRQEWTENLIQLFLDQDYEGPKALFLVDDRPTGFEPGVFFEEGKTFIEVFKYEERFPFLMAKYDRAAGVAFMGTLLAGDMYMCVLDDDDLYLPHFLSDHAAVLEEHPWSYPNQVFSSYGGQLRVEDTGGRFWASSAYRLSALEAIGGYGTQTAPYFDQEFIARLHKQHGDPGRPKRPGYMYNWEATGDNHVSYHMSSPTSWYEDCQPSVPTGPLVPKYNDITVELLKKAKEHPLCV